MGPNFRWLIAAGVAGAVVLAFVGAPQSMDVYFFVGPDDPRIIGEQLAVAVSGAVATAAAILLARHWPWLLAIGAVGVLVAYLFDRPPASTAFTARVNVPGQPRPPLEYPGLPVGAAALVAAAGVLLIGLLGVARELLRTSRRGASLAGLTGCAAFFGVAVIGRFRTADTPVRVAVIAVAAGVVVLAVVRLLARPPGPDPDTGRSRILVAAAAAALIAVLPTVLVAITGERVYGTVGGGIAGLFLVAVMLAAAAPVGVAGVLAVSACALVMASPVLTLVLFYDVVAGHVWYAWPIALAGVLLGAALAGRRGPAAAILVVAALPVLVRAATLNDDNETLEELILWAFLLLTMATVAAVTGTAVGTFARLDAAPALAGPVTAGAVGVNAALTLLHLGADGRVELERLAGRGGLVITAMLLVLAAGLLLLLGRHERARGEIANESLTPADGSSGSNSS